MQAVASLGHPLRAMGGKLPSNVAHYSDAPVVVVCTYS
jgi:hypothetical protein